MSVVRRLVLILALAVVAIVVTVAIGADRIGREVADTTGRARITHLLGLLRTASETNLSFGLPLDQMASMQALIEREKFSDPSILAIDVFYPEGRSVYSTDPGALGEPVLPAWVASLGDAGVWRHDGRGEMVFGTRIENDLGTAAGGIAITVSDKARLARELALRLDLGGLSVVLAVAGGLLAAFAGRVLGRRLVRPFREVARELKAERRADAPLNGRLAVAARAVRARWQGTDEAAARAMSELRAIDDAG